MPKFDLVSALEDSKRQLLVDLLRQHPELTLGELQQLARGDLGPTLRLITIADLLDSVQRVPPAPAPRGVSGRNPAGKAPEKSVLTAMDAAETAKPDVNTRTAAGREALDEKIIEAVTAIGGPVSAAQVQARVGGTNMQVRAGLNRLIEAEKLTWSGQARGTRYHLA